MKGKLMLCDSCGRALLEDKDDYWQEKEGTTMCELCMFLPLSIILEVYGLLKKKQLAKAIKVIEEFDEECEGELLHPEVEECIGQ